MEEHNNSLLLKEVVVHLMAKFRKIAKSATCIVFHKISAPLMDSAETAESNLTIHRPNRLYSNEKY